MALGIPKVEGRAAGVRTTELLLQLGGGRAGGAQRRVSVSLARPFPLAHRRPPTQLRWVAPDGRLMVRCEGPEAAQAERSAGLARQALAGARGAAEQWLKDLINLAALY